MIDDTIGILLYESKPVKYPSSILQTCLKYCVAILNQLTISTKYLRPVKIFGSDIKPVPKGPENVL
jgi:hypothetical protein